MSRIVFSTNSTFCMCKFRYGVMKRLVSDGHEVHIVAPHDGLEKELREIGVILHPVSMSSKGMNPFVDLLYLFRLFFIYLVLRPDIVFHYTAKSNIYGTIAAKLAGAVSVPVLTGLGYIFIKGGILKTIVSRMYKTAFIFADKVWFINEDDKKLFLDEKICPEKKAFVLPGEGINTAHFAPGHKNDDGKFVFLMIARLLWDKGVREYVTAANEMKKRHDNVRCLLIGQVGVNNPHAVNQEALDALVAEGGIEYLGYFDDIREYITASDCVVLPSYREGKPMVLLESCSMAVPVIASRVVGCWDVVRDGYNGFLFEPRDVESLLEVMEKMYSMPVPEREKIGQNGRRLIEDEYDDKYVIEIYTTQLDRLLNKK